MLLGREPENTDVPKFNPHRLAPVQLHCKNAFQCSGIKHIIDGQTVD